MSERARRLRLVTAAVCSLFLWGCGEDRQSGAEPAPISSQPSEQASFAVQVQACETRESDVILYRGRLADTDWSAILKLPGLRVLELYDCGQVQLHGVDTLKSLDRLRLGGFACDDETAKQISQLTPLKVLNLPDAQLTDDGLAALVDLPNLELLRLGSPDITDQGLSVLSKSTTLRFVHLLGIPIHDKGLRVFHNMPQLESLYIDGGQQTDAGMQELIGAQPKLHFHYDQLHLPRDPRSDGH